MTKQEHLEAKRAFDRVKQHPHINDPSFSSSSSEEDEEVIEYKARDGTVKTMKQSELKQRLEEQQAFIPLLGKEDGGKDGTGGASLSKSEEGKATLEEVCVCVCGRL